MENNRYKAIDGLRTVACIGIVMMHVRNNNSYQIKGILYEKLIPSFVDFVFLFMVISAFGMCCGYLEKMKKGQISLSSFYKKRYRKVLPFFTLLILLDIVISRSKEAIIEGFADITLLFGLFPNNISVIGVGWFLGLIFAFYFLFPFYSVLLESKKSAWGMFILSLIINYVFGAYFGIGRRNIVFCLCYFLAGGLLYLYKKELVKFSRDHRWIAIFLVVIGVMSYFVVGANTATILAASVSMMLYAFGSVRGGVLQNRFTNYFSSISMEVYLAHMVIFRAVEKIGLNKAFGNGWMQYSVTVITTLIGTIIFSIVMKKFLRVIEKMMSFN